jgi:hypothetical protein
VSPATLAVTCDSEIPESESESAAAASHGHGDPSESESTARPGPASLSAAAALATLTVTAGQAAPGSLSARGGRGRRGSDHQCQGLGYQCYVLG